jgi:hypothetical protein
MAYINGNKPIVTDGLIYALDFGNHKSYTSGFTTANSLAYDQATTSVSGSPVLTDGILDFTSTKFVKRDGSLPALDPNGTFTVMIVGKSTAEGTLLHQDTLNTTINPSSSLFGFGLDSGDFSRSYPGFTSSSLQHVTYRYSEGTIDTFINGIPVTASVANASLTNTAVSNALFIGSGSAGFAGSLAQFYVYNRALSADEIYTTYLVSAERNGLPTVPKPYTQDENVYKYVQTTGITDLDTISAIDTFVSNLKSNGLWNKMTAIYPFLTTSTGSQAINLKDPGVLGLGLTGSFTGSNVGLTPASSTAYVDTLPSNIPYPSIDSASAHLSLLSYDVPQGNGFLAGNSAPAVGGDLIVSSGSRIYHVYRNAGTSSFYMTNPSITNVEVLVVAGGGGGGTKNSNTQAGGGGAGGLVLSSSYNITPSSNIQVIVGNGGLGAQSGNNENGRNGDNSIFDTVISLGGGGGGFNTGLNGGSGGGGGSPQGTTTPLVGSPGGSGSGDQGNEGGWGTSRTTYLNNQAGGGGGHGTPGLSQSLDGTTGPSGGSGSYFSQFAGINVGSPAGWFAGGGGGAIQQGPRGFGGIGGGGIGGLGANTTSQGPGVSNTGGGGGGAYRGAAGSGGSGIVIVSYNLPASALTGSGTGFYLTDTALTASVNSQFTSGITGSGNIGFLTVSRTGSNSFSIRKNNSTVTVNSASLGALPTDIFFNTANLAGSGSLPQPTSISYASIGAGLTDSEVSTYYNLVSQFQTNLKRQNTLLDNYSGAAAAYSLRRIGPSGYFGPAIRVRRDSDNTLRDIGFTSDGQLDTVGLLDFVGVTGSGFVQTWYDQSGNSNNASQATSANQPLLLSSGSIITRKQKPYFQASPTQFLRLSSPIVAGIADYSWWITYEKSNNSGTAVLIQNGSNYHWLDYNTIQYLWEGIGTQQTAGVTYLINTIKNYPTSLTFYRNSVSTGTTTPNATAGSATAYIPGNDFRGTNTLTLSEFIYYPSNQFTNKTALDSNINSYYKIFGDATASFDPDYQSFITATGITQPTQSAALETLVSDLKSYGLWSKMKAIYPMVTDKNNRFSRSEDFSTTWTKVSSSVTADQTTAPDGTSTADLILEVESPNPYQIFTVTNNGASAYTIDGSDNPTLNLERGRTYQFDINALEHPFYIMTGSGAYTLGGQYDDGVSGQGTEVGTLEFNVPEDAPDTLAYVCGVHLSMAGTINVSDNTDEHYLYETVTNMVSGNEYVLSIYGKFYNRPWIALQTNEGAQAWFDLQNGATGSFTGSSVSITDAGSGWYRCALFFTGSTNGARNQHIHLADADGNYSYTGVADSGSYLWGAQFENGNLLGPYRKTEGSSFTTGSMLDQMKFNLKSTSSFNLTTGGNINIGYSGFKGDGVSGYLDTNLTGSSILTPGSTNLSAYVRSVVASYLPLVASQGPANSIYSIQTSGGNTLRGYMGTGNVFETSIPSGILGFALVSRTNTNNMRLYKNNLLVGTNTTITTSLTYNNTSFAINANNNQGTLGSFSNHETAFATIGDGLTDYEAKALYWIVQKFQTTLGRQVY